MSNVHSQDYRIRFKKGLDADLDKTATANLGIEGEPAYTTDTHQFFIHDGTGFLPPNFDMLVSHENEAVFYENEAVISY